MTTVPDPEPPATDEVLSGPLIVEFPFTRSTGPVIGAFLTGLRERVVLGIRGSGGRVLCPPAEYDPVTAAELSELVRLPDTGTVTAWAWNAHPRPQQPLDTPFAWALVRFDGADTALLHALDAPPPGSADPRATRTGLRVRVRWAEQRSGAITDIACFEALPQPEAQAGAQVGAQTGPRSEQDGGPNA